MTSDAAGNGQDSMQRRDQIRALTRIATIAYVGWVLWLFQVVQRATEVTASRFASAWEEKIEALSFISFAPNVPVLAVSAVAAAAATWLAGPTQDLALAILLRLIRWSANGLVAIAIASAITVIISESWGPDQLGTVAFRLSGALMASAVSYLCLAAGRTAPGG